MIKKSIANKVILAIVILVVFCPFLLTLNSCFYTTLGGQCKPILSLQQLCDPNFHWHVEQSGVIHEDPPPEPPSPPTEPLPLNTDPGSLQTTSVDMGQGGEGSAGGGGR